METGNLSDAEFKTLQGTARILKELSGDLNSIKKTQAEITLSKIKKIHRESTVERMKLRIKSVIWNIRKKKTFNQNSKKKKEFKK